MTYFVNVLELAGVALAVFVGVVVGLVIAFRSFNRWRKSGFCRHKFKLLRTNSFGQHHWHKCERCGEERLM